jgi:MFS family permease
VKPGRSIVYMLLLSGCAINYVDRVVLSVSARPIAQEFHLSTVQLGYLFSAFLWTYLVFVLPWGAFVDRVGTRRSTTAGMVIWSFATILTAISGSFFPAFLSRLLMGFGESSTYPAGTRTIREWIPAQERGFATTVFNCGGYLGPALGSILIGYLVQAIGWRGGFLVCAGIGMTWAGIWWCVYRLPEAAPYIDAKERHHIISTRGGAVTTGGGAPLFVLLRSKTLWGLFIVHGCATYTVYLFLSWLPSYLQASRDLSILKTGFYTSVPYAVAVPGTMLIGWLSDRMLRHAPVNSGRRRNMVAIMLLCSSCILLTPWVSNITVTLALFSFALTSIGSSVGLNIALLNDSLPDSANVGRAAAFLVTGANLFGILAPIATGYVVSGTGSYDAAFVIAGVLLVVGAVVSLTMTRNPILCPDQFGRTSAGSAAGHAA